MASSKDNVMVLAFPEQGHINPLMDMAGILASRGFAVTFPLSTASHHLLTSATPRQPDVASIRMQRLPPQHGEEEEEEEEEEEDVESKKKKMKDRSFKERIDEMEAMEKGVEKLLEEEHCQISFILADFFVNWAHKLAAKHQIPLLLFFTSNASACYITYHTRSLQSKSILPFREEDGSWRYTEPVDCFPGIKLLRPKDFPSPLTFWKTHFLYRFALSMHDNFHNCSGIILNTFEDLEPLAITSLRNLEHKPRIFAVGPLPLLRRSHSNISYWSEQEECLSWLDKQTPSSVLYVAFGSNHSQSVAQFVELAFGLEASGQPFLWVVRPNSTGVDSSTLTKVLPAGFGKNERGMVISWAPQLAVLSHPSVGGFMSHMGWNSTIDNLSVGGVPFICWPQSGDQMMNCRMCVDDWKIGLEMKEVEEGGVVEREEVERVVRKLMHSQSEEGKKLKEYALHAKSQASKAVRNYGSSNKDTEALLHMLASGGRKTNHD